MTTLTPSAENTLCAIAWMVNEPDGEFRVTDLVRFENTGCAGRRPCRAWKNGQHRFEDHNHGGLECLCGKRPRTSQGMRGKTLPSLIDRQLVERVSWGRYRLTEAGYALAEQVTGGYGLL